MGAFHFADLGISPQAGASQVNLATTAPSNIKSQAVSSYLISWGCLATAQQACLTQALAEWIASGDVKRAQIADNIRQETALQTADFQALLQSFACELASGKEPMKAWEQAARQHQLRGAPVPASARPELLGRAIPVKSFADNIVAANAQLSAGQAQQSLRKYAGQTPPSFWKAKLQPALLGHRLIWATFHEADSSQDPCAKLPQTSAQVRDILGLGHFDADTDFILLTYPSQHSGQPLALHRPSVADADNGHFWRPHPDPAHPYGYTRPLSGPSAQLSPQPELVHRSISAVGVRFPYRIAT